MPLVDPSLRPGTPQHLLAQPAPIQIAAPEYHGVTVDTKLIPVSELLTHVEGSSWTTNYYSQVITSDSQVTGQSLGAPAVVQQYNLIRQMELKVTSPLVSTQDNEQKTMSFTGVATVYPFVKPNQGDMFLADVGSGREGLFEVTNVNRLTIQSQTCHTIEYSMVDWATPDRLADLKRKTNQTFQYVRDFLRFGQNPLLFAENFNHLQSLRRNFRLMVNQWFDSFFSKEYGTVILPGQDDATYDPYLVDAVLRVFTQDDSPKVTMVRQLNVDDDSVYRATSLWTAILNRDQDALINAFMQFGKVFSIQFSNDPMMEGIRWSGIIQVIYPNDPVLSVDYNQQRPPKLVSGEVLDQAPVKMSLAALLNPEQKWLDDSLQDVFQGFVSSTVQGQPATVVPAAPPPLIHNAMMDGYYVFSEAFYKNDLTPGAQSQLEILVRAYLNGEALNYRTLDLMLQSVNKNGLWNAMCKFYYIPILLILVRATIRSF